METGLYTNAHETNAMWLSGLSPVMLMTLNSVWILNVL
jgi:hypothetical protein